MAGSNTKYDLISDEAMFLAREFLIDDQRYPTDGIPGENLKAHLTAKMQGLCTRHLFWMHQTDHVITRKADWDPKTDSHSRVYATVRVDQKHGIISGDLHADIGRRDWLFSWKSDALFSIDHPSAFSKDEWAKSGWDILAVGQITPSEAGKEKLPKPFRRSTFVAVALKIGDDRGLRACRMILSDHSLLSIGGLM